MKLVFSNVFQQTYSKKC